MYYGEVMYKNTRIFCGKPISTTRFSFSPSICYVPKSDSKKSTFYPIAAIGLKFGGWVAGTKWTRTIPHIGGQTHRRGGGGKWHVHHLPINHPIPCYISKKAGSIEYKFCMQGH